MRRMLDPKTIGGGGGGGSTSTPMHVYRVTIKEHMHYLVHTTKDYDFTIGTLYDISDFATNSNYSELRKKGFYPASGVMSDYRRIVTEFEIYNEKFFQLSGYKSDLTNVVGSGLVNLTDYNYQVVKLF